MEGSDLNLTGLRYLLCVILSCAAAACLWTAVVWWQTGAPTYSSQWLYDIVQLKTRAAESERQPKLILIGGSSTLFGISAKQIRSEAGIPTVNFGLHASLGAPYMLWLVEKVLKPGDTVLLIFEYYSYTGKLNEVLMDYVYARDPQYFTTLPLSQKCLLPLRVPYVRVLGGVESKSRFFGKTLAPPPGCYTTPTLDKVGDETCNAEANRTAAQQEYVQRQLWIPSSAPVLTDAFQDIRNFRAWAARKQIRVLATYPNTLLKKDYENPDWRAFFEKLAAFYQAAGIPVLGSPQDAMYDISLFFDTPNHLTDRGVRIRTERLITMLKPYF